MVKSQESRLKLAMDQIEKKHEERLKHHARNFEYEITKLCDVAKVYHEIIVEQFKKVHDSINLKVDVLADAITKFMEYHTSFSTKLDAKSKQDSKVFEKL
ncbi:unnamed protein product [Lactuca saligna]|uniref:Uncharacterized protein n=1 Tax=Lactuca saligna TaxID=75948 RepID=A0AA36EFP7_LACSI|nr:unnamed protein product [Lactuca saligna]